MRASMARHRASPYGKRGRLLHGEAQDLALREKGRLSTAMHQDRGHRDQEVSPTGKEARPMKHRDQDVSPTGKEASPPGVRVLRSNSPRTTKTDVVERARWRILVAIGDAQGQRGIVPTATPQHAEAVGRETCEVIT